MSYIVADVVTLLRDATFAFKSQLQKNFILLIKFISFNSKILFPIF